MQGQLRGQNASAIRNGAAHPVLASRTSGTAEPYSAYALGQARPQGALSAIDTALQREGFELIGPDLDGYDHRYQRERLVVDVLAPDGIKPPARLGAGRKAVGVPGGSQALSRSETVTVTVRDRSFQLRRPTLLGAVLIKARSLMVPVRRRPTSRGESATCTVIVCPRRLRPRAATGAANVPLPVDPTG
jgi:hypothetical protein